MIVELRDLARSLKDYTGRVTVLVHDREDREYAAGIAAGARAIEIRIDPDDVWKGHALIRGTEA